MMTVVKSNFVTVDSFLLSMWSSLRQTLIYKLAHVKSSDQPEWIKTEDRIGDLLNDDQMLTIENTDQTIKTFENYVSRRIDSNTTVLLAGTFYEDTPEVVTLNVQIFEMTVLMTTTTPGTTTDAARTGHWVRVYKNDNYRCESAVLKHFVI